jgi:hypothetical protein
MQRIIALFTSKNANDIKWHNLFRISKIFKSLYDFSLALYYKRNKQNHTSPVKSWIH